MHAPDTEYVREAYREVYRSAGYAEISDQPIVSRHESLLFVNSNYATLRDTPTLVPYGSTRVFSIQTCVRMQGIDDVGNGTASTSFRLMGNMLYGGTKREQADEVYGRALQYLGAIGLLTDNVSLSYFGGDHLTKLATDSVTPAWWRNVLPNVLKSDGSRTWYLGPVRRAHGTRRPESSSES